MKHDFSFQNKVQQSFFWKFCFHAKNKGPTSQRSGFAHLCPAISRGKSKAFKKALGFQIHGIKLTSKKR